MYFFYIYEPDICNESKTTHCGVIAYKPGRLTCSIILWLEILMCIIHNS